MFFFVILQALFLALPGAFANPMPIVFDKLGLLKFLDVPVDFRRKLWGEFIFGTHKTWRGIVAGIFGGLLAAFLQILLYKFFPQSHSIFLFSYNSWSVLWWGFLVGLGALLGDLVKSFFKRRLHVPSGAPFFPFDQLDLLVGGIALGSLFYIPPWQYILILFVLTPLFHFLSNVGFYFLGLKKVWW